MWGGVRVEKGTRPRVGLGRPEVGTTVSEEQNLDIVAVEWGDAELGERLGAHCVSREAHSLGAVVGEGREYFVGVGGDT